MSNSVDSAIDTANSVLTALLSWIVLAAISIIISGKLIVHRLPIGIRDDAKFELPLLIFRMKANGEEVLSGFLSFIMSLGVCVFLGGPDAYRYFKAQSGIDVGQWNSLCVIASFLSLAIALLICLVVPIFKGAPVVDEAARDETLEMLRNGGQK